MAQQQYINRDSLATNLLDRYNASPKLGGDIGTAKLVGTDGAKVNAFNGTSFRVAGKDVHSINFNLGGVTPGFTWRGAAGQYSTQILGLNTTRYWQ